MTAAAERLQGMTLAEGWQVNRLLHRSPEATGGIFSHSYEVEKEGTLAFMKALDFSEAFEPGQDTLRRLREFISAFENERDVLEHCKGRRLSHVTLALAHGFVDVPDMGSIEGRVYYLIFEMADGDVRRQLSTLTEADELWCMEALRSVALGLWQVHRERIAHQDVKPSNVLNYSDGVFKLADFGRASRAGTAALHDEYLFPGDRTYAPFELLYGYTHPDFIARRVGTDLFMLGNIAAFLFSGTNITADVAVRLDPQHHWKNWTGTYSEVLPYVQEAFGRVLADLSIDLPPLVRDEVLSLVAQLCEPDLLRRGHPRGLGTPTQFSLERYVSRLDVMKQNLIRHLRSNKLAS